jgi:2-polyprenyl-6-methoxyphenol hydroxylase-like FAD-dependent oxidoreductase
MARVLVVGGSLGGLFAANLLLRAGHEVTLIEKAEGSLDGRGAGIVTHDALVVALRAAGAVVDDTLGVPIDRRVVLDASGAVQASMRYPQVLTSWSRLYALLRAALPADFIRGGHELQQLSQDANGVRVRCTNGAELQADLLVASDGIRSSVRAVVAPEVQPVYSGYMAWRGVCDEWVLSDLTRSTLFETFGFGLPDGEQMLGYPVAGAGNATQRGKRGYNFVWYRPARGHDELRALLTDADGHYHPLGIPPHKVSWRHVAAMRQAARGLLAPQWAEVVEKTSQPFLQPIFDLLSPRLAHGRIALMGDAAFVARPHVGMGVAKAGDDAMALVRAITRHGATPAALQAYDAEREPAGRAAVERARWLGAYIQAKAQAREGAASLSVANNVLRDVHTVLTETAIDLGRPDRPA